MFLCFLYHNLTFLILPYCESCWLSVGSHMWYMYYKASTAHPAPYKSNKQLQTKQRPSLFHFLKHVCVAHSGKWKFRGGCRNTFIVASGCREAVKSIERTADKCRQGSRVVYIINSYNQEQSKSRNCCGFCYGVFIVNNTCLQKL